MIRFEFNKIEPMTEAEAAAFRAAQPQRAAQIDASMRKIRDDLVAEFGEETAERLMPAAGMR